MIFGLLYGGDYLTSKKKESMLIASAKSIVENNAAKTDKLLNYEFNLDWLTETDNTLDLMSNTDKNFPNVSVIVQDSIEESNVFLAFRSVPSQNVQMEKKNYIFRASKEDRDYLHKVFNENSTSVRFSASDGNYELFYPYSKNGRKIVLYFYDRQQYGKFGS